ncbi:MAG: Fe-S cluster assembly sulfur transfer protein SufU [Kineosporiaceae bacterium]
MTTDLEDLYREVILDHARRPRRSGLREPFTTEVHQVNPLCGDEVTMRVRVSGQGERAVVADVSYESLGCAVSVAATSVLAESVTGGTVADAHAAYERFRDIVTGAVEVDDATAAEADEAAFAGVARLPRRVKCALLGWTALREALLRSGR